jgi:hypothetical protein
VAYSACDNNIRYREGAKYDSQRVVVEGEYGTHEVKCKVKAERPSDVTRLSVLAGVCHAHMGGFTLDQLYLRQTV